MARESHEEALQRSSLKAQIRESYTRVVYSMKTQEKQADSLMRKITIIKTWYLVLNGFITGSFIVTIFGEGQLSAIIGAFISSIVLILNSFTKDFELASIGEKHRDTARRLWEVKENYLSLLTDFDYLSIQDITQQRDELQDRLATVYSEAPRMNFKAYHKTQLALKSSKKLTFSDQEIDLMLPKNLRGQTDKDE